MLLCELWFLSCCGELWKDSRWTYFCKTCHLLPSLWVGLKAFSVLFFSIWHYRIILNLFYFHRVRVFAPFTPFLTEHMYQNLKHLIDWSKKEEETNKRSVHAFTEQFYRSNLPVRFTCTFYSYNFYQSNLLVLLWLKIVSVPFI